jgi:hypothetical protein
VGGWDLKEEYEGGGKQGREATGAVRGDSVAEVQRRIHVYARSHINSKMLVPDSILSTPVWGCERAQEKQRAGNVRCAGPYLEINT